MNKFLLPCALLLSAHAAPTFAQTCEDVGPLPATISVPGKYCLAGNQTVNMTSGNAITIAANNVHLDCVDFSITNTATSNAGSSTAIGWTDRNRVTVKNCRIDGGFTNGIMGTQTLSQPNKNYYINILDNHITGPYRYGILVYGSAVEIDGNRIYDIGGQANSFAMGIRLAGSTLAGQPRFFLLRDNLVAGTNAPNQTAYGIYSDNTVAGIFLNNGVSGTTGTNSFGIRTGGQHNRITDNHVVGSGKPGDVGIYSLSATDNCFDNYIRATTGTIGCDASMGNY